MTKKVFDNIAKVLHEFYGFDTLDIVEFVLRYEKVSEEEIPVEWMGGY